jgi:hypothetical protein
MGRAALAPALAATLLLTLAAAAAPAGAAAKRDCGSRAAHTVKRNQYVRVFFTERPQHIRRYYACMRGGAAKPVLLGYGDVQAPERIGRLLLRRHYVTYVHRRCSSLGGCDFLVKLLNVRSRAEIVSDYLFGSIDVIVATPGGAAAFLATTRDGSEHYIQKLDSLGVSEIDRGPNVRALTLRGSRLHWLNGVRERSEPAAHVQRCGPIKGAWTVALDRSARVYRVDPYGEYEYESWGCLLPGGKPMLLGTDRPGNTAHGGHGYFQIVNGYVGWLEYDCGPDFCLTQLHIADLRRRRVRSGQWHGGAPFIFLNRRGFAAELILARDYAPGDKLFSLDSTGEQLLDSGPGIDSVSIDADAVRWRHDGEPRMAPLH